MVYSKHEAMDGRVDLVREETASDDIGEPFDGLMKLINETSLGRRESGARVGLIARTRVEASHAGIAPRRDWWDHPETTREEVARYLRAQDETFADADDHPRVNAALAHAATYGLVRSIRELVAQGAQVNAGGAGGSSMWAPLHHAARHKRRKAVRALLDLGARVNISTWGRWTPLHFAVAVNDRAITRMLLDAGADMYAVNSDGQVISCKKGQMTTDDARIVMTAANSGHVRRPLMWLGRMEATRALSGKTWLTPASARW